MDKRISARLSSAQGRRFGLTVGGAFLLLSLVPWWRAQPSFRELLTLPAVWHGRHFLAAIMAGLGASLAGAGLAAPTRLGPIERAWMALAHAISRVTTPIFMAVVYFGTLTTIGMVMRFFGRNPIAPVRRQDSFWMPTERRKSDLQRQF